ncbi:MAG: 3-oxoacyl-ACP synthase III family protein [Flavobacteriales bacterium]
MKIQNKKTSSYLGNVVYLKDEFHANKLATDLAKDCGNLFFEKHPNIKKTDIDFLIYCTEAPDYISPAGSCIVQEKLGLPKNIGTFDLSFGCSGYTQSIALAKSLVESQMGNNVLVITSDFPTRVLHPEDKDLVELFKDAASCSLVSSSKNTIESAEIGRFVFGTDGSGELNLRVARSAFNNPIDENWLKEHAEIGSMPHGRMEMNGLEIFRFSMQEVPVLVQQILEKNQLFYEDIDLFVFHQASEIILKSLKRKLKIPDEKFYTNFAKHKNTVSATIPICIHEAIESETVKKGMNVLVVGFGVGYSWSGTILKF